MERQDNDQCDIFISYSHGDKEFVSKVINKLKRLHFRIWFDKDIDVGTVWPDEIASQIKRCSVFLLFLSLNSEKSSHVRNEIHYAADQKKQIICVNMIGEHFYASKDDTSFPGIRMKFIETQNIHYNPSTDTIKALYKDLNKALSRCLSKTNSSSANSPNTEMSADITQAQRTPIKRHKRMIITASAGILLIAMAITFVSFQNHLSFSDHLISNGYSAEKRSFDDEGEDRIIEHGNNSSNLNFQTRNGFAVEKDGWFYLAMDEFIYRLRADGEECVKLAKVKADHPSLNLLGDSLYFFNETGNGLQRIHTDGSGFEFLSSLSSSFFVGVDTWLYFLNPFGGVVRMSLDGHKKEKICDVLPTATQLYVDEEWVYFVDYTMDDAIRSTYSVKRVRTDGFIQEECATDAAHPSIIVEDGWLYYISNQYGLCRKNLKTDQVETIQLELTSVSSILNSVLVQGDNMFFLNEGAIWRKNITSGYQEKLCGLPSILGRTPGFNVAGSWLFLTSNHRMFRCPTGGDAMEDITEWLTSADFI